MAPSTVAGDVSTLHDKMMDDSSHPTHIIYIIIYIIYYYYICIFGSVGSGAERSGRAVGSDTCV